MKPFILNQKFQFKRLVRTKNPEFIYINDVINSKIIIKNKSKDEILYSLIVEEPYIEIDFSDLNGRASNKIAVIRDLDQQQPKKAVNLCIAILSSLSFKFLYISERKYFNLDVRNFLYKLLTREICYYKYGFSSRQYVTCSYVNIKGMVKKIRNTKILEINQLIDEKLNYDPELKLFQVLDRKLVFKLIKLSKKIDTGIFKNIFTIINSHIEWSMDLT